MALFDSLRLTGNGMVGKNGALTQFPLYQSCITDRYLLHLLVLLHNNTELEKWSLCVYDRETGCSSGQCGHVKDLS